VNTKHFPNDFAPNASGQRATWRLGNIGRVCCVLLALTFASAPAHCQSIFDLIDAAKKALALKQALDPKQGPAPNDRVVPPERRGSSAGVTGASFVDGPVRLVAPDGPGSPADIAARAMSERMGPVLGQTVGVRNSTRDANPPCCNPDYREVAEAAADGRTLLVAGLAFSALPAFQVKVGFDPLADFEYLGVFAEEPFVLVGSTKLAATNFAELQALAASGTELRIAVGGVRSSSYLCAVALKERLKWPLALVQSGESNGGGHARSALLRGDADLMCEQVASAAALVAQGQVKGFAVTTSHPLAQASLAPLPTVDSQGFAGFNFSQLIALYAPKGTPPELVLQLNEALRSATNDEGMTKRLVMGGLKPVEQEHGSIQWHRDQVSGQLKLWAALAAQQDIHLDERGRQQSGPRR
jgi:tripartite-type tricarboxylate transporter receptor subunit TctC